MKCLRIALAAALAANGCAKASAPAPTSLWTSGTTQKYALELESSLSLGKGPPVSVLLASELLIVARVDGRDTKLGLKLLNPRLKAAETSNPTLATALQRPFEARMHEGKLASLTIEAGAPGEVVALWRTIASSFSYSSVATGDKVWIAAEADAAGAYQAKYQAISPNRISRQKIKYEPFTSGTKTAGLNGGLVIDITVAKSTGEFVFSGGMLTERSEREVLSSMWNKAPVARSETKLKLARRELGSASANFAVASPTLTIGASEPYQDPKVDKHAIALAKSQSLVFSDVLSELRKSATDAKGVSAELESFGQMVSILQAHAERVSDVSALIRRADPATNTLLDVLGSTSTDESQSALVELAEDTRLDINIRRRAAYAAIRSARPTPMLVEHLKSWVRDSELEQYGMYELGTAARHLREVGSVERSRSMVDFLSQELASTTAPNRTVESAAGACQRCRCKNRQRCGALSSTSGTSGPFHGGRSARATQGSRRVSRIGKPTCCRKESGGANCHG
ncbi:MAG: hypothetical protein QM784_37110 [Polyangiaceae bacterium]